MPAVNYFARMLNPQEGSIYCFPQTDCFVVSQLFSVARYASRFTLGSKPAQIYVRLSMLPLSLKVTYISSGIVTPYVLTFLLFIYIYIYIYIYNAIKTKLKPC